MFLTDLKMQARDRRDAHEQAARDLAARERWLFRVMLMTATLAPLLVVLGFALIVTSSLAVGTLSAVVGLIDAAGSAGLRGRH